MSKLQQALAKLQKNRTPPAPVPSAASGQDFVDTIARPVEAFKPEPPRLDGSMRRKHAYGGPPLAVDRVALRRAGLMAPEAQERRVADEYRQIKRPVLRIASGKGERAPSDGGNLLVVTSALSGEGKTFTCINLCLSLAAEKDWSVLLVDADVAKPHVSRLFAIEERPGLLDLLRDHSLDFNRLVCPTDVPGLAVLPAGGWDDMAAELLASERMEALCSQLSAADPRRLIVFDSPPLLQTTEAPVLASHAGQLVMVVQADRTSQQQVGAALAKLDERITTSLILNQAQGGQDHAYGTYYGGGYGQDSSAAAAAGTRTD